MANNRKRVMPLTNRDREGLGAIAGEGRAAARMIGQAGIPLETGADGPA